MNLSTMLVLWLQSGFVLILALFAMAAAKRFPSLRLAIARVSLLAALGLFVCLPWLGSRVSPVVPVALREPVFYTVSEAAPSTAPALPTEAPTASANVPTTVPENTVPIDPLTAAIGIWALGVCVLTIHLGLGYFALARIRRSSRRVSDPVAQETVVSLAKATNVKTPWLMESKLVGVPFVAGALHPTIFLPEGWATSVDSETLHAVLSHEMAHIGNGDIRWALLHRVASNLLWPQPLLWLLKKPMTAASEELCDQHVLDTGISQDRYADCLLNLREGLAYRPAPSLGIGAFSSQSQLGKRIEALMDSRRSRFLKLSKRGSFILRACTLAVAVGATVIFASPARPGSTYDPYAGWVKEPYSASVQIVDKSGKPFTGEAQAFLVLDSDDNASSVTEVKVSDGKVAIDAAKGQPDTRGTLVVKAKGYGLAFTRLWPVPTELKRIQVGPAASLKGRFLLPDGKPAAGLNVWVNLLVDRGEAPPSFLMFRKKPEAFGLHARTDADGRYRLEGLPANVSVGMMLDDPSFAMLTYEQRGDTSVGTVQDIRLQLGSSFSGRVLRNGKPVAGVVVAAQENHDKSSDSRGDWAESVTDEQGRYTLSGLGSVHYNIALNLNGSMGQEVNAPAHEAVLGTPGKVQTGLDFHLTPGALIEGTVFDRGGSPIKNTMIGCYGPAHPESSAWVQTAKTDSNGKYKLRVPPGKQRVYWMGENGSGEQRVGVQDGQTLKLDIHVGGASLSERLEEFSRSPKFEAPSLERPVKPQTASFGPGAQNFGPIKLKNGVTARVAYIQDDTPGPHNIWRPDGSSASDADVKLSLDMTGFANSRREGRSLYVRLDIEGAPRTDYHCLAAVPHKSDWTVWQTYGDSSDDRSLDMATFRAPHDLTQTDLRVGIAAGPYKQYATWKADERSNLPIRIAPAEQTQVVGAPTSTLTVTIEVPPSLSNAFMDFQAFDRQGREFDQQTLSVRNEVDDKTGKHYRYCTFAGGAPSEVALVNIRTRDYEWVTFKGLRLYPNK